MVKKQVRQVYPRFRSGDYCPICGVQLRVRHRCDPKTLAGIDAALKVDRIDQRGPRTEGDRLYLGFNMLDEAGDDVDDDDPDEDRYNTAY